MQQLESSSAAKPIPVKQLPDRQNQWKSNRDNIYITIKSQYLDTAWQRLHTFASQLHAALLHCTQHMEV